MELKIIARIENDFTEKFGIPRQSGLCELRSKIIFERGFSDKNAVRGLSDFSHLWLIWGFSEFSGEFSPTVRPPRLGGNIRKGVFATRSPNRPNPLGLSAVRLCEIEEDGSLIVEGADLMNGTPIYDIKPYIPYADSIQGATNGWALCERQTLSVDFPAQLLEKVPEKNRKALIEILGQDPRPQYQNDPGRVYTMSFGAQEISFRADEKTLTVVDVKKSQPRL